MEDLEGIKILVISTIFKHHASRGGYDRLSNYLSPSMKLGVDETSEALPPFIFRAYKWLYEWVARLQDGRTIDLIHIYYAEEYYRFTSFLFPNTPVIATFHQPPTRLRREITSGGTGGRVSRFTHNITKSRFKNLAAAIVMEEQQKKILCEVMSPDRIHVIYHGIDVDYFQNMLQNQPKVEANRVITVGNWLRDWDFYESVLQICESENSGLQFVLINRSIEPAYLKRFKEYSNFKYVPDLSDVQLVEQLSSSKVHFLPLIEATANNSVMESLAVGCPLVLPNVFSEQYQLSNAATRFYKINTPESAISQINQLIELPDSDYYSLRQLAREKAKYFDWRVIAERTADVYKQVLKKY